MGSRQTRLTDQMKISQTSRHHIDQMDQIDNNMRTRRYKKYLPLA